MRKGFEMNRISIEWISGRPVGGAEDDEERAIAAAEAVLDAAGADYAEAEATYRIQWLEYEDELKMTGLAALWIEAREAADIALTAGWNNPGAAYCDIRAA